jgi:hypothetical protein
VCVAFGRVDGCVAFGRVDGLHGHLLSCRGQGRVFFQPFVELLWFFKIVFFFLQGN